MTRFWFVGYPRSLSLQEAIARAEQDHPGWRVCGGREMCAYWSLILEESK